MLDINLLRADKGGDPERVRESQRKRFADVGLVDKVIDLDQQWRQVRYQLDQQRKQLNALTKEVAQLKKTGQDTSSQQSSAKALGQAQEALAKREAELIAERDSLLSQLGNLVHDSVPVNNDEAHNRVVKEVGTPRTDPGLHSHPDLVAMLGIANLEAGQAVAGARGYYLMNEGVLLNQALINYALQFASARGYSMVQTPFFMTRQVMAECAQLSQFDEELYKLTTGPQSDDKYLIATSEQTLAALHRRSWLEAAELPLRYVGYSTCFRREAGSHGRDTLGLFRLHQFEKVEQFVITSPEGDASWKALQRMVEVAEEFYASLELPYRLVDIVSGALNNAAAKKTDLEAWFPASKTYRELVSCSNCTDYQSRRLEIRVRPGAAPKGSGGGGSASQAPQQYAHMLNSTLTATQRTLCCVLENHQVEDGVRVPAVLRPFTAGVDFIPFRKVVDSAGKLVAKAATKGRAR